MSDSKGPAPRAIRGPGRGMHGAGMKGGGPKDAKKILKRLMGYLKPYRFRLVIVFLCILISAGAGTAGALFLEILIDDYIKPLLLESAPVFTGLLHAVAIMGMIYIAGILSSFLYSFLMVRVSQGTLKQVRDQLFEHMQSLPIRYFDTHTHGDIMSRYTNDTDTLRQVISQTLPQFVSSAATILVVFISMVFTSIHLTVVMLLGIGAMLLITGKVAGKSGKFFVGQQASLGSVNGYIEEMVNGQKVVKVFNHEEKAKEGFDALNEELRKNAGTANMYANILMPIMNNMSHLIYVVLAIVGGALAINGIGGLTLGAIAAFLQLSKGFTNPVSQIAQQLNMIMMALAGAERIFELMDEKPEADEGEVTLVHGVFDEAGRFTETAGRHGTYAWKCPVENGGEPEFRALQGDVRFADVDFGYDEDKIVLHNIKLYAEPGQKVAFVGATGAGKTTITNLINRFYDIADGKIRYDGININKIRKADLRRSLGIVLQDVNLFTGTVMDNIRYGCTDATDEEVIDAAKLANAHEFISHLPKGYETMVENNGENLSQGQRQLLSIARAAVADPPVMILDEATSSIDTRTESLIQKGMDRLMQGRTVFVIAHRLSTVRNANVIMVLEDGRIIERGSHEDLIEERGKYYQLYTGAFELE